MEGRKEGRKEGSEGGKRYITSSIYIFGDSVYKSFNRFDVTCIFKTKSLGEEKKVFLQ